MPQYKYRSATGFPILMLTFHTLHLFSNSIFTRILLLLSMNRIDKGLRFSLRTVESACSPHWDRIEFSGPQSLYSVLCAGEADYIQKGTKLLSSQGEAGCIKEQNFYPVFNLINLNIFVKNYFRRLLVVMYVSITYKTIFANF